MLRIKPRPLANHKTRNRLFRPRLEILEVRNAPCVSTGVMESFDTTPIGSLPAGWSQWSTTGAGVFGTSSALSLSAPNGLAADDSSGPSNLSARAWLNTTQSADVQVSSAIYLNSLIPAQVLARSSNLDSTTPTYYAASITRGLQLQLVGVVRGVSTILGQVSSPDYVSGKWACVTLYVSGTNLRAQVERLDRFQYLNGAGQWQTDPAWALNLTDASIAGSGFVGIGRPSSYTGVLTFDDFGTGPTSMDSVPPRVTITSPPDAATLSGLVNVQAAATDNIGVTKVEFLVDNVVRSVQTTPAATSPYLWTFDTSTAANGSHVLKVLASDAAGNVGEASEVVTTQNNTALSRPSIPQHYAHIRVAELAYAGNPAGSFEDQLLTNCIDLVIPDERYLGHINMISPGTPQLIYTNVSSVYLGLLTDWLAYADAHALNREGAFYHAASATPFAGNSPSSQPVNWFWAVEAGGTRLTNLTSQARGSDPGGVTFGGPGESVYIGYPDPFREVNLDLATGAGGEWSAALEYASAVDSTGNPTAWSPLTTRADGTAGLTQSGRLTFDPPADWKTSSLNGSARLFFIRFRTLLGGTAPVANTILGRDYVLANGTTSGTIPAFDQAADANGDGYLSDAEYANRAPGKDARFFYESRIFAGNYGQMRFATNPSDLGFKNWAVDYNSRYLNGQPLAGGLFVDNSGGSAPLSGARVLEPTGSYSADYAALLNAIGQAVEPRWLLANTVGGSDPEAVIQKVQGYYQEFAIRALAHNYQQFEDLAAFVSRWAALTSPAPYAVLDSLPTGGSPSDARTQLATLAYYYLLADPQTTFLDFFGGYAPSTSWTQHWSPAAAYNIGQPAGSWSLFASGTDPSNAALTYHVYQRAFSNALVLYKPLSFGGGATGGLGDATATTHALGGAYYPLLADGSLGAPVPSVTLRNGEGSILIKTRIVGASNFVVTGFPSTTSGAPGSFTITVKDTAGNTVTGYTGTVHFTSSDALAVLPLDYTFTAADAGTHRFQATLRTPGIQSLSATDSSWDVLRGTQSGITVNEAVVSRLTIDSPLSGAAGSAFTISVTALDQSGDIVPSYAGTVHFTSSDHSAVLPADYTFTQRDAGTHAFEVILKTAGNESVTATDTTQAALTASFTMTVDAAAASTLEITGLTSPVIAGTSSTVTVTARDRYGNRAHDYTGSIRFMSTDPAASLPANYTFDSEDAGVHTFSNGVILRTAGTQSLTVVDTVNGSITGIQSGITVNPAAAASFLVAGFASPVTAGKTETFTVTARDAYGNTATSYNGIVHFSSSDPQASLPADYTFTDADAGVHTFSATLKTAGTQSLTATDSNTDSITGTQSGISVSAAAATHFSITAPANVKPGTPFHIIIKALDAYDNVAKNYRGRIHFMSSDRRAVLPGDYTFTSGDGGMHDFTITLRTVGVMTIGIFDVKTPSVNGSTNVRVSKNASVLRIQLAGHADMLLDRTAIPLDSVGIAEAGALFLTTASYFRPLWPLKRVRNPPRGRNRSEYSRSIRSDVAPRFSG